MPLKTLWLSMPPNWSHKIVETSEQMSTVERIIALFQILNAAPKEYGVIGSCAIMVHMGVAPRVPGDIDIVVSQGARSFFLDHLRQEGFQLTSKIGYYELVSEPIVVHVVERCLKLLSPDRRTVISEWHYARDLSNFEKGRLTFIPSPMPIETSVVSREAAFLSHILAPLNNNILFDCLMLLAYGNLRLETLRGLCRLNASSLPLLDARLTELVDFLSRFNPPAWLRKAEYLPRAASVLQIVQSNLKNGA